MFDLLLEKLQWNVTPEQKSYWAAKSLYLDLMKKQLSDITH